MPILKVKKKLHQLLNLNDNPKVILGLSGGADSVFLFHVLKELAAENKLQLICAHLNHGWREEAKIDAVFCEKLCAAHNIPFILEHASNLKVSFKDNGSKEELGRNMRRTLFLNVKKEHNADFILLAHHLQDQQETFFWRLMRGSSLSGLTCMKEKDGSYIRPLLNISKDEILEYLKRNDLSYIEDETNKSDAYLRNRIRKYVLPSTRKCDDRFDKKFSDTLTHLQKEEDFLKRLTTNAFNKVFFKNKNAFAGNLEEFFKLDPVLQHRTILHWLCTENVYFNPSSAFFNEILRFLSSKNGGSHSLNQAWKIKKKKQQFWIEKTTKQF